MTTYHFSEFELDVGLQELRQADDPVAIEPQVFDLLRYLIENRERLVTRDELFENVWRGRIVSDATLSSRIKAARQAVGDTGKHQRVIQTLPRRGFRFVAALRSEPIGALQATGLGDLSLPNKPSIAVMPFANLSSDPEQDFFADGMTEDIITGLSRFRSLFVIARNSTFAYKGKAPDVREVARDLGVRYILEGSVRRGGNRIRITAQLIDAVAGGHHWADRYDRDLEDILEVQDDVTEAIITAIAPEIEQVERNRAQRNQPDSLNAWGLYQRGLTAYHATTHESLVAAIRQFDQVNDLDPGFAPAFAFGADARTRLVIHYANNDEALLHAAREKAATALTLDIHDPDCLWVDGKVQSFLGHHTAAISRGEEAVALNPTSAMAHQALGFILGRAGRPKDALSHINQAIRLSPRDLFMPGFLGLGSNLLFDLGHYQDALDWAMRANRSPNPRPVSYRIAAAALSKLDRREEAEKSLAELISATKINSAEALRAQLDWVMPSSAESNEQLINALKNVGLPE